MSAFKTFMWIKQTFFSLTFLHMLKGSLTEASGVKSTQCDVINPLLMGILFFLAAMVILLLILLCRALRIRHDLRVPLQNVETTPVSQNCALNVLHPSSNGANDSSSTSSESHTDSLADISSSCQRYVSRRYPFKDSDYMNTSKVNNKTTRIIDYENVTEPQNITAGRHQNNCDDGNMSDSSDTSVESAVNYSKVVFIKADK